MNKLHDLCFTSTSRPLIFRLCTVLYVMYYLCESTLCKPVHVPFTYINITILILNASLLTSVTQQACVSLSIHCKMSYTQSDLPGYAVNNIHGNLPAHFERRLSIWQWGILHVFSGEFIGASELWPVAFTGIVILLSSRCGGGFDCCIWALFFFFFCTNTFYYVLVRKKTTI